MNKILPLLLSALFVSNLVDAQSLAINADGSAANASALLDIKSTTKGLLIPRMTKAERTGIPAPATGLLVFQNAPDSAGFYYYDGGTWNWMAAINGNADTLSWKRSGNALTNPAAHFIGTTDNRVLNFKVYNTRSGIIDNVSYNAAFGYASQMNNLSGTHNTSMGYGALISNTTGNYNTSVGAFSSYNNVAGIRNTAIGTSALYFNNSNDNTAVGYEALNQTSSVAAKQNTAVGSNALRQNSSGTANTAVGDSAGYLLTAANYNVFFGKNAGRDNLGSWTTLIGIDAGPKNTANGSVFIGSAAGMKNTSGFGNTFVGDNAGREVITGANNSFFGSYAGQLNAGSGNSFFGRLAGYNNFTAGNNVAMGFSALYTNTFGNNNVATGSSALYYNSNGNNNVAYGNTALFSNTTGSFNVAVGISALRQNTSNSNLVAIGDSALYNNGTGAIFNEGIYNTAVGSKALYANTTGYRNTAIGYLAMEKNTIGNGNTFTGAFAGRNNITGGGNSFYGNNAGAGIEHASATAIFGNGVMSNYCDTSSYNSVFGVSGASYLTKGDKNVFVGYNTVNSLKIGNENTVVGYQASVGDTADLNVSIGSFAGGNGDENVFVGHDAGKHNNLGTMSGSTYIGSWAGFFKRANYSLLLGYSSTLLIEGLSNASAIGAFSRVDTSNAMVLGSTNINVGIGFTKPYQAKFTVSANNSSSGSTIAMFGQGQRGISIQQNNPTIAWNQFRDISAANATRYMGTGFAWVNHMDPNTGIMYWNSMPSGTGGAAGGAETNRMTLTTTGSLGLNVTPNGSGQLQFQNVLDNRKIVMWETANNSTDFFGFGINSGTLRYQVPFGGGNVHRFYAGNNLLLTLFDNGNATLSGLLTQLSDARLKQDIVPINSTINGIKKINAYSYYWKDENRDKDQQIGLLAQEVEKVYPQLVKKDTAGLLSVNYNGFIPLLIKGMQEQQQQIEELKTRVEELISIIKK